MPSGESGIHPISGLWPPIRCVGVLREGIRRKVGAGSKAIFIDHLEPPDKCVCQNRGWGLRYRADY